MQIVYYLAVEIIGNSQMDLNRFFLSLTNTFKHPHLQTVFKYNANANTLSTVLCQGQHNLSLPVPPQYKEGSNTSSKSCWKAPGEGREGGGR